MRRWHWVMKCFGVKKPTHPPTASPSSGSYNDDLPPGCPLCAPEVAPVSGLHHDRLADFGAGDRGQCRHLYPGEFCAVAESAGRRSEDTGATRESKRLLRQLGSPG